MSTQKYITVLGVFLFAGSALSAPGTNNKIYQIEYASKSWNDSPVKVDQAFMFIRDKDTSKIAKVVVEESAPDSGIFSGRFSIDWVKAGAKNVVVYVPPDNLRRDPMAVQRFNTLLQSGKVETQPVLVRDDEKAIKLDVYDNEIQLKQAQDIYQRELKAKAEAEKAKLSKPLTDEKNIEAAKLAEKAAALAALNAQAALREQQRLRLEQLAAQQRQEEAEKANKMSAAEKQKRKDQAKVFADQGMKAYQASNFKKAEEFFRKATELDPENDSFYLKYGVSLYRNEKMDEALIYTRMTKDAPATVAEKNYYLGLIHYRLQEYKPAAEYFSKTKETNAPVLAASGAFYEGLTYLTLEDLDKSQAAFEWVLDNSSDPSLDEKADEFIEKIANLRMYKKLMAQKWKLNAKFGATYDSNILLTPASSADQSLGLATDDGGSRMVAQGDLERRLSISEASEWTAKLSSYYMYSLDSKFNLADPWLSNLSVARSAKGVDKNNKAYQWSLRPGYEILYMDSDDDGTRDNVSNSMILNGDVTFIERDDYFSGYSVEVRQDDSLLDVTDEKDNADSLKYTLKTTRTYFLDKTKKRAFIGSFGYVGNDATGDNETYYRIEGNVTYAAPFQPWLNTIWSLSLGAYRLKYPDSDDGRSDTNLSLSYSLNKTFSDAWSFIGTASYMNNASSLDANTYNKYSIMGLVGYSWAE